MKVSQMSCQDSSNIKEGNIFLFLPPKRVLVEGVAAKRGEDDDREVVIDFLPCNFVCVRWIHG
jgi:hypothetical protein